MTTNARPLAGIRVLSLAEQYPGPYTTLLLADLGADVVLVERPSGGDPARQFPEFFAALNRNKRSLAVDLKRADGKAVLERLLLSADVVLEGFRPGTMERLGLGHRAIRARNPRLVYASVSGFGQDGPYPGGAPPPLSPPHRRGPGRLPRRSGLRRVPVRGRRRARAGHRPRRPLLGRLLRGGRLGARGRGCPCRARRAARRARVRRKRGTRPPHSGRMVPAPRGRRRPVRTRPAARPGRRGPARPRARACDRSPGRRRQAGGPLCPTAAAHRRAGSQADAPRTRPWRAQRRAPPGRRLSQRRDTTAA